MFKKILACLMLGAATLMFTTSVDAYESKPVKDFANVDQVSYERDNVIQWIYVDKDTVQITGRDEANVRIKWFLYKGTSVVDRGWDTFHVVWRGGFAVRNLTSNWTLDTNISLALAQYMNDRY